MFTGQRSVSSGQNSALHELEAAIITLAPDTTAPVSGTDVLCVSWPSCPFETVQVDTDITVRKLFPKQPPQIALQVAASPF